MKTARTSGLELGETYVLGDSPLVLLTALSSAFDRDPSSSRFVLTPVPSINDAGAYEKNPSGRLIRVYTRLLFEDFFSKLSLAHTRG